MNQINLPLVSIVIPVYNHAQYLAQAINSVLAQDYPKVELIVLNDGSTDNTIEILQDFGNEFYWETHENIGQSKTLNKGWEMAKGDILSYLSADDILESHAVSCSVAALIKSPNAVAVYGDFELIDPDSRRIRRIILSDFNYNKMLTQVSCPVGPGAFFRRSTYQKAGPWNALYRQMPDYDFWLRVGQFGEFVHLKKILAGFRVHSASQTYSQTTSDRAAEPVLIVSNFLSSPLSANIDDYIKKTSLANACLVSAQLHVRSSRFSSALLCVGEAFKHSKKAVLTLRTLRMLSNSLFNRLWHKILWRVRRLIGGSL